MSLDEKFQKAVGMINSKPGPETPKVNMKQKLSFYALYKQATEGKCTAKAPSIGDVANYYKWKAWTALKDMPKEEAKKKYIEATIAVLPASLKSKL